MKNIGKRRNTYSTASIVIAVLLWSVSTAQTTDLKTLEFNGTVIQITNEDHQIPVPWGQINVVTGAGSENDGKPNTQAIVNKHGNWSQGNYAANICAQLNAHGFDDWYLPSINELLLMHQNRQQIGGFQTATYWSSTENPMGVTAKQVAFPGGYVMEQPKSTMARVRCIRRNGAIPDQTIGDPNHHTANVLVASRYALKSEGEKGLIFGAKFLSVFTTFATSVGANEIIEGLAKGFLKDLATKALLSSLPGMDAQKVKYVSFAFPLKNDGSAITASDLIILLEYEKDRDLVPLNVPLTLTYTVVEKSEDGPKTALKVNYNPYQLENTGYYPYRGIEDVWYTLQYRQPGFRDFRLQSFGVVDGYLEHEVRQHGQTRRKRFLIVKQYDKFEFLFMQRTALSFVAIDVDNRSQLPAPGSVIHFWGETKALGGQRLSLPHFAWNKVAASGFIDIEGYYLLSGHDLPKSEIPSDHSVFMLATQTDYWDAVVVDLNYGEEPAEVTREPYTQERGVFTDPRDGQTYRYVQIGDQVWMAENLRYLPSVSGPGAGSTTTPYYYVYGYYGTNVRAAKATENYRNYGVLYNWPAARKACPPGWKLPNDAEWSQIRSFVRDNSREISRNGWQVGGDGTNDMGFICLPGGSRERHGFFDHFRMRGFYWKDSFRFEFFGGLFTYFYNRSSGFSLRCVRDCD